MIEWRDSDGALANVDEKFWLPPPIHLYFFFPFTSRIFSEWKLMNFFRASSKNFFKSHTWTVLHKKIREYFTLPYIQVPVDAWHKLDEGSKPH